ncbi:MAG TPA: nitroreductase family protein [Kofleriaceae bacterium]|nr:nitroreductase family protein [Kofleriaceae bacterium]
MDTRTLLRCGVADAVLAPSTHNTQPWRFTLHGASIDLCADLSRHLRVIDPDARQLVMSCGAALYNLRVSLRAAGREDRVRTFPHVSRPELLARVTVGADRDPSDHDRALAAAIHERHTDRGELAPRPVSHAIMSSLAAAAAAEGTTLTRLTPRAKQLVSELIAFADRRALSTRRYRRELARWLVPSWRKRRDGIPIARKEYRSLLGARLRGAFASLEQQRVIASPAIVVFSTRDDEPASWLACGQALQAVLLTATSLGLTASFLNQVLEVPDLRERVAALLTPRAHPQLILRLGFGAALPPAPRRTLGDVLDEP